MITDLYKNKIVWGLLGFDDRILLENYNGLKIFFQKFNNEFFISLFLDSVLIMTTQKFEHDIALNSIKECPDNSRVFIGGLGFGLMLLYLAESGKSKEVLVVEKDKRVLKILLPKIKKYLDSHYPNFNFKIIDGDAYEEILTNGMFDWIFIDISDCAPIEFYELSKQVLNKNGVYTPWKEINND